MTDTPRPRFGIMTAPMQVDYHEVLRVWREADAIPEIEHAWLFDHLMPIGGDPDGPAYEGWTLLSALGPVRRIMPASRGLARTSAALSSVADAPRRRPPPPCSCTHQTPLGSAKTCRFLQPA